MAKIIKRQFKDENGNVELTQYHYLCPGCDLMHAVRIKGEGGGHDFNMDFEKPTFSPSLLANFSPDRICHSFIKEGKIQFLGDCWHSLKGQTVELPDIENM